MRKSNNEAVAKYIPLFIEIFGLRFGFEHSVVFTEGQPYLARWIIYCGGTLRLHHFFKGDEDRALHDHPWWFATFPLGTYHEVYWDGQREQQRAVVPFLFHYRRALFRHRVLPVERPIWTIVITGRMKKLGRPTAWGFYPAPDTFIPYNEWR